MRIQFDNAYLTFGGHGDGNSYYLCLRVKDASQADQFVETMQPKLYDAELKIHRDRRSLEANAYLWTLCQKIAEAVQNVTKEDVYREAVKHAGKFEFILCYPEAAEIFKKGWEARGLGWIAELTDIQTGDYQQIICYYGSSVYDSKSMSVLLEYVVNEAKELDIDVRTPDEIARMEALWQE